jgi:hypothetical protein
MPSNRSFSCLFFLLLLLSTAGWGQNEIPPDRGSIQGGAYHNVRFGFAYKIPDGWDGTTIQAEDVSKAAATVAKDKASAEKMSASVKQTIHLVTLTREGSNDSIQVAAADLYFAPEYQTPDKYLDLTEQGIGSMTAAKMERLAEKVSVIQGHRLVSRNYKTMYGPTAVYQSISAFAEQKFIVLFVGSFRDQAELEKNDVAASLSFDAKPPEVVKSAESKANKPRPQDGETKGNTYTNPFFGLTLTVPESWEIQEQEAAQRLRAAGERQMEKKDQSTPEEKEAAAEQVKFMMTAMPKVRGGVLMSFCQDLLLTPEMESAEAYLKGMTAGMPGGEFVTAPKAVTIGGRNFTHAEYTQHIGEMTAVHSIYVVIEKRFALVFDVISANEALRKEGQKAVEGMVFAAPLKAEAKP